MPDLPPNLASTSDFSNQRYAEEQLKLRKKEEDERARALAAEAIRRARETRQDL